MENVTKTYNIECEKLQVGDFELTEPRVNTKQFIVELNKNIDMKDVDLDKFEVDNPEKEETLSHWVHENFKNLINGSGESSFMDYDDFIERVTKKFLEPRVSKVSTRQHVAMEIENFEKENSADLLEFYKYNYTKYPGIWGLSADREYIRSDRYDAIQYFEENKKKRAKLSHKVDDVSVSSSGKIIFITGIPECGCKACDDCDKILKKTYTAEDCGLIEPEVSLLRRVKFAEKCKELEDLDIKPIHGYHGVGHANVMFHYSGSMMLMGICQESTVDMIFNEVYEFIRAANIRKRLKYTVYKGVLTPTSMNCVFGINIGDQKLDIAGMIVASRNFPDKYNVRVDKGTSSSVRFVRIGITEADLTAAHPRGISICKRLGISRTGPSMEIGFRPHPSGKIVFVGGKYDIDALLCRYVAYQFLKDMYEVMGTIIRINHGETYEGMIPDDMIPKVDQWLHG